MHVALQSPARQSTEYRLGRREVPVDVMDPRQRRRSDATGVPQPHPDRAQTAPLIVDSGRARGPGQAELTALAAGELASVELDRRYRLDAQIGKGGMARVFRGELRSLGRAVAVKVLDESRSDRCGALGRFMAEARITAGVRHPNVVEVSDFGATAEGLVYLVMELLDGEDLRRIVRREGPLGWARTRSLILQLCAGVAAAHERGVVHRDLKPSNCFIAGTGDGEQLKLLDFGIALATTDSPSAAGSAANWTHDDSVIGTPEYMSPEQACGAELDERSDIYSIGIILAELLTGKVPFRGKSSTAIMAAHTTEAP